MGAVELETGSTGALGAGCGSGVVTGGVAVGAGVGFDGSILFPLINLLVLGVHAERWILIVQAEHISVDSCAPAGGAYHKLMHAFGAVAGEKNCPNVQPSDYEGGQLDKI